MRATKPPCPSKGRFVPTRPRPSDSPVPRFETAIRIRIGHPTKEVSRPASLKPVSSDSAQNVLRARRLESGEPRGEFRLVQIRRPTQRSFYPCTCLTEPWRRKPWTSGSLHPTQQRLSGHRHAQLRSPDKFAKPVSQYEVQTRNRWPARICGCAFHTAPWQLQHFFRRIRRCRCFLCAQRFLITTIIVQETREKRFSIITFYERRIRRILPALLLVITVCTPFVWIWALPHQLRDFSQSIIATLTFLSNVLFWRETGYFSISAEVKPLLHTWNLAVEEQYCVVFPILAALALRRGLKFTFWPLVARLLDDWSSSDCLLDEPESSW